MTTLQLIQDRVDWEPYNRVGSVRGHAMEVGGKVRLNGIFVQYKWSYGVKAALDDMFSSSPLTRLPVA